MKTITCKKLGTVVSLTVGKTYEIISETENRYAILNDKGVQANYGKNLFNDPVEVAEGQPAAEAPRRRGRPSRAKQAARAGVPVAAIPEVREVAVPPVRVVNEINVTTTARNSDGDISLEVQFDFGGGLRHSSSQGNTFASNGISASCGIQSLSGVDNLISFIGNTRTRFINYLREQAGNIRLADDINVDTLFSEVSKGLLQDVISSFQGEDADIEAGMLILSTTENSINESPFLRRALEDVSVSSTTVNNPNSGNNIVVWNLAVEEV